MLRVLGEREHVAGAQRADTDQHGGVPGVGDGHPRGAGALRTGEVRCAPGGAERGDRVDVRLREACDQPGERLLVDAVVGDGRERERAESRDHAFLPEGKGR